ncbi:MAG: hypothetical protein UDM08_03925 [Eggerthellaceae bacterium]|nr:hypothetical protein [Eggerthellaceae bacterium]
MSAVVLLAFLISIDFEIAPLVIGPVVIVNLPLLDVLLFSCVSPLLLLIALFLRPVEKRGSIPWRIGRALASALCTFVAMCTFLYGALFFVVDEPYLLEPTSNQGDRVLIVEHHFLLASSGDIYYVPAGSVFAESKGGFSCDDAYSPVRVDSYSLSWTDRTAYLEIWSDSPADPMVPWSGYLQPNR